MRLIVFFAMTMIAFGFLPGCIVTHIDEEFQDPTFSWETLKRDEILMLPLQDLRESVPTDPGVAKLFQFFSDTERKDYPEKFKQVFFKTRKDIRVYGAGGAYDHIIVAPNLKDKAKQIIDRNALSDQAIDEMKDGTQDIRFFMAFAVTKEDVAKSFSYEEPSKLRYATKTYTATRAFNVTMSIWDSKENKTVWSATKKIAPQNIRSFRVPRRTKPDDDADTTPVLFDANDNPYDGWNFAAEMQIHPERFPEYPGREPGFSNSFKDFALAFPIQPSEEKYIEYESFTYHRPEATFRGSQLGRGFLTNLELGSSSIIHNRYRVGAGIGLPLNTTRASFQDSDYDMSMLTIGLVLDAEFEWTKSRRILIGSNVATGILSGKRDTSKDTNTVPANTNNQRRDSVTDAVGVYSPHIKLLFGERQGAAFGLGVSYRLFSGLQEDLFKDQRPSNWSVEGSVAYTFRGF